MKFILIFLLLIIAFSCSGEVEKKKAPEKKPAPIESKSINPLKRQSNPVQEHVSGGGESRVSGAPSTTHISGQ